MKQFRTQEIKMKKSKICIYIFLSLFITVANLASVAQAENFIDKISVTDQLFEDGTLNESILIMVRSYNESSFSFALPTGAYNIVYNGTFMGDNSTLDIPLDCTICNLSFTYSIDKLIVLQSPMNYMFSRIVNFAQSPTSLNFEVRIPSGYVVNLNKNEGDPKIVPNPSEIKTDGSNIIIAWSETRPSLPKIYSVNYVKHQPVLRPIESFMNLITNWNLWLFNFVYLLLGICIGVFLSRKLGKKNILMQIIPSFLLGPDEKTVLNILRGTNERLSQKDLSKRLGWSKSKVSSIMTNLERKRIVKRERYGRNYKIDLIKDIDKAHENE